MVTSVTRLSKAVLETSLNGSPNLQIEDNRSLHGGIYPSLLIDLTEYNHIIQKNSIRDARTPQPGEIIINTMRYRSSETVQRSGYFQSSASYIKAQLMFK